MAKAHIGTLKKKKFSYELNSLTKHAAVLGTTGSGKTVMCKVLVEEALMQGIPVIAIDPKGDIGGLAINNEKYDFRPFVKNAKKVAEEHVKNLAKSKADTKRSSLLAKTKTKIYTPKSSTGIPVSMIPKLDAPEKFREKTEQDPNLIANFVEPVSESICQLAGIKGSSKEKAQALISSILIYNWNDANDLDIVSLIEQISEPPFETMGSLDLDDFINEKERKKIVASVNLLLTSPSKQAWKHGETLEIAEMFKPGRLSIFDMRQISTEEKQFVVEQIMQEIYKFLLHKGGSEKLKYILYFDELAGIIPPPPAAPPSKKLLGLLVRQARAFGLGVILATQNPGDIDYKILGNVGTRFIGKLRTENDIEKVAVAMDLVPSALKEDIAKLKIADFVYNNAVDNKKELIHARWLYSYHGGPLKPDEIHSINNPHTVNETEDLGINVEHIEKKHIENLEKEPKSYSNDVTLSAIKSQVKKYCDNFKVKMVITEEKVFVPHLKIVIEPMSYRGAKFDLVGPYVFDLTHKLIPEGNYLKNYSFRENIDKGIKVLKPKRSVNESFQYAIRDAKDKLRDTYYSSDLVEFVSNNYKTVVKANKEYLKGELEEGHKVLKGKKRVDEGPIRSKIAIIDNRIAGIRTKIRMYKAKRTIKKLFSRKKLSSKTRELKSWESQIEKLKKERKKLKNKISDVKNDISDKKGYLKSKVDDKAHSKITEFNYRPTNKDIVVHATILLIPK